MLRFHSQVIWWLHVPYCYPIMRGRPLYNTNTNTNTNTQVILWFKPVPCRSPIIRRRPLSCFTWSNLAPLGLDAASLLHKITFSAHLNFTPSNVHGHPSKTSSQCIKCISATSNIIGLHNQLSMWASKQLFARMYQMWRDQKLASVTSILYLQWSMVYTNWFPFWQEWNQVPANFSSC